MTCAACRSIACTHSNPAYAGICPPPLLVREVLVADGNVVQERWILDDAQRFWGCVEGVPVHTPAYDHSGGATSSGKANDISGEVLA